MLALRMDEKELALKIKAARKKAGITQKEAAENMGVTREFYARYESGRVNITIKVLNKIAVALGAEFNGDFIFKEPNP